MAGAIRKPNSVPGKIKSLLNRMAAIHLRTPVAGRLLRPTRGLERATPDIPLFGLAPGGVYLASPVTRRTGALLPHPFTLTFL